METGMVITHKYLSLETWKDRIQDIKNLSLHWQAGDSAKEKLPCYFAWQMLVNFLDL